MGIYDREYYRREGPSFLGSFTERGKVCKWLIGINVVVFVLELMTRPVAVEGGVGAALGPVANALVLDVNLVLHGQVWRLLTYAFLHDPYSWQHIVFNMLFLWWFGSDVEDLYGPREFLAFYLLSAFLGGGAFVLATIAGWSDNLPCLGASGAVTAVMVLFAIHYPTRRILLFFLLPVPIWLFVGFQIIQDAFVFLSHIRSTTAVTVHLAGAAFAFCYYKRHWRLLNLWSYLRDWQRRLFRPRLHVYREQEPRQPVPVAAPPAADVDEQLEAKVDAVLEKVARFGQSSLTDSERQLLLRASEVYKRKRT